MRSNFTSNHRLKIPGVFILPRTRFKSICYSETLLAAIVLCMGLISRLSTDTADLLQSFNCLTLRQYDNNWQITET